MRSCKLRIARLVGDNNNKGIDTNKGTKYTNIITVTQSLNSYTSLKIEIQYMPGFQPDAAAINHLTGFVTGRLNKPGGIVVVQKEIPASAAVLSVQEAPDIEKQNRTVYTTGNQLGIYFLT